MKREKIGTIDRQYESEDQLALGNGHHRLGHETCRATAGQEGDVGELPVPPEIFSLVLLCVDGPALGRASCVSKALRAIVTAKHWESAARRARWLQSPTPAPSSFRTQEEATSYWRRWSKHAAGDTGSASGRVVVVGGNEISSVEASSTTEAFLDVRFGESIKWTALPRMEVPRSASGSTVDRLGSLFALGGWNNEGAQSSCERLEHPDIAAATVAAWQQQQQRRGNSFVAAMFAETSGNAGAAASSSSSSSCGGSCSLAPAPVSTPTATSGESVAAAAAEAAFAAQEGWRWEALPPLQRRRCFLGAAFEPHGALLAVGGGTGPYRNDAAFETVEVLLPGAEAWVAGPSMGQARCGLGVTAMADGKIAAVGGYGGDLIYHYSAEVLDPSAERWTPLAPMQRRRTGVAVAVGPEGRLYAIGGSANGSHGLSSVETLDLREGKWRKSPGMIFGRAFCCASFAPSGCLYVVGGSSEAAGIMRTVEVFEPRSERWRVEESFGADDGGRAITDACLVFQP